MASPSLTSPLSSLPPPVMIYCQILCTRFCISHPVATASHIADHSFVLELSFFSRLLFHHTLMPLRYIILVVFAACPLPDSLNVAFPQDRIVCLLSQHILPKQSHSPAWLPLASGLMTRQMCISGRALSPEFHIHITSSLVAGSTVMSHRHFKVNVSSTKLIICHSKSVLYPTCPCLETPRNPPLLAPPS